MSRTEGSPKMDSEKPSTPTSSEWNWSDRMSTFSEALSEKVHKMVSSKKYNMVVGIFLALVSGLCLTWYSFVLKTIQGEVSRTTITVTRGSLQFLLFFLGPLLLTRTSTRLSNVANVGGGGESADGSAQLPRWKCVALIAVTAAVGGVRLCLLIISLDLLPVAMVHTILNGSPLLVMVLGHFLLQQQDRLGLTKAAGGLGLVAGLVLTFRPYKAVSLTSNAYGYLTSGLALLFSALGSVLSSKLKGHVAKPYLSAYIGASIAVAGIVFHMLDLQITGVQREEMTHGVAETEMLVNITAAYYPDHSISSVNSTLLQKVPPYTNLTCIIDELNEQNFTSVASNSSSPGLYSLVGESVITACAKPMPPYIPDDVGVLAKIVFIGVLGSLQQFCLIAAVQYDKPSRVTMVRSSSVIVSFLIQETLGVEKEPAEFEQYLGALFIFLGIVLVALEKHIYKLFRRICPKKKQEEGEVCESPVSLSGLSQSTEDKTDVKDASKIV